MGISHPVIEWSPSQQDGLSSLSVGRWGDAAGVCGRIPFCSRELSGAWISLSSTWSVLSAPGLGGKVTSATITFWFQKKEGVLIFIYLFIFVCLFLFFVFSLEDQFNNSDCLNHSRGQCSRICYICFL